MPENEASSPFYLLKAEDVCALLEVNPTDGLMSEEVTLRRQKYGTNDIIEMVGHPWWRILLSQFTDFMIVVLIVAAVGAA